MDEKSNAKELEIGLLGSYKVNFCIRILTDVLQNNLGIMWCRKLRMPTLDSELRNRHIFHFLAFRRRPYGPLPALLSFYTKSTPSLLM